MSYLTLDSGLEAFHFKASAVLKFMLHSFCCMQLGEGKSAKGCSNRRF